MNTPEEDVKPKNKSKSKKKTFTAPENLDVITLRCRTIILDSIMNGSIDDGINRVIKAIITWCENKPDTSSIVLLNESIPVVEEVKVIKSPDEIKEQQLKDREAFMAKVKEVQSKPEEPIAMTSPIDPNPRAAKLGNGVVSSGWSNPFQGTSWGA